VRRQRDFAGSVDNVRARSKRIRHKELSALVQGAQFDADSQMADRHDRLGGNLEDLRRKVFELVAMVGE
jgi:hypothetical protein